MIWTGGADMGRKWVSPPQDAGRYVLGNVHIPPALCALAPGTDGWCTADILVDNGRIETVVPTGSLYAGDTPMIDAGRAILLSGLVDCHTHLDKAHVAAFTDFPPGDLAAAIEAMAQNQKTWTPESLARRVTFSLQTAHAYGVRALRSHVGFSLDQTDFVWQVLQQAVEDWRGHIDLQLVPLANILDFDDPVFRQGIHAMAAKQGRVGMFLFDQPDMARRLRPVFEHADAQGWDIDLHVDEGLDSSLDGLATVAGVALETGFSGTILCGHCVALNTYGAARRDRVITRALAAGLHFVALPVTNLYLQGRCGDGAPGARGMAPVRRLAEAGAYVSMGADNVRDGFCAFGDFDPLAVLNLGAQVGHLDQPARDWSPLITTNPARTMGLDWDGRIVAGAPADLVLVSARTSGEMSLRSTPDRQVIRAGDWLDDQMPDMRDLIE